MTDSIADLTQSTHTELLPYSQPWFDSLRKVLGEAACKQLGFYAIPPETLLSVVIPVYNERDTIHEILKRVRAVPVRKEIILIDDCSRDGTREMLKTLEDEERDRVAKAALAGQTLPDDNRVTFIYHEVNRGKGAAVKTGFGAVRGQIALIQDADLEYDPAEYPRLMRPIVEGQADVVFGSRFLGDQPHRVLYFWHYVANKMLTTLSNCFSNLNLTDMETCYKLFTRQVVDAIGPKLAQERFGIEPELAARVARHHFRVYEISVSYSGRTYEQGKKITWKDGLKALWCIVRYGIAD